MAKQLYVAEWFFTILFTIEYALRLWCIQNTALYARSFYGVIDLLGIIPTYLSLFVAGTQYLLVIRVLRVLRVFRVLRMVRYVGEAEMLTQALRASSRKIIVFISTVIALVIIFGSLMYLIEGEEHGFTSIPKSIYWAIITLTTVGYGDIAPMTPLGQGLASVIMIMGYGIIAVPTGIVTLELSEASAALPTPAPARRAPRRAIPGKPPTAGAAGRTCSGPVPAQRKLARASDRFALAGRAFEAQYAPAIFPPGPRLP